MKGLARFNFKELCDENLGAEDYLNLANICNHIFIEEIPNFDEYNSNQQLRFITLIDILYDKKISLTLSMESELEKISTSKKHSEIFKRTVSRLYEMTASKNFLNLGCKYTYLVKIIILSYILTIIKLK